MIRVVPVLAFCLVLSVACSPEIPTSQTDESQSALDDCTRPIRSVNGTLDIPRCAHFLGVQYQALAHSAGELKLDVVHDTRFMNRNIEQRVLVPAAIVQNSRWIPCQLGETILPICNEARRLPPHMWWLGPLAGDPTHRSGPSLTFEPNGSVAVTAGQGFVLATGGTIASSVTVTTREVRGTQRVEGIAQGILYLPGFECRNPRACEPCGYSGQCDVLPDGSTAFGGYLAPVEGVQCGAAGQLCCRSLPMCNPGLTCGTDSVCHGT